MKALIVIIFLFVVSPIDAATLYWKGGSGDWHDPLHWSFSSGGLSCGRIPLATDDVVFDHNSFSPGNDTLYMHLPAVCRNMTWTTGASGATWTGLDSPANSNIFNVFQITGSLLLAPDMDLDLPGAFYFISDQPGNTITTNGNLLPALKFNNATGSWVFQDSLAGARSIELERGSLNSNGQFLRIGSFFSKYYSDPVRELNIENSTLEIQQDSTSWEAGGENLSFFSEGSLIRFTGGSTISFDGGELPYDLEFTDPNAYVHLVSKTYNSLVLAGDARFLPNTTIHDLVLSPGGKYEFLSSVTITGAINANGTCGAPITLRNGGFLKQQGSVVLENVILEDFEATGGADFQALNSVDLGGNTGWDIDPALGTTYYWIGGSGDWHDPSHWATTSGGTTNGCAPWVKDNVIFDVNSFTGDDQVVSMSAPVKVASVTWTGDLPSPIWSGSELLEAYGSFTLSDQMTYALSGELNFKATGMGNSITTGGNVIGNPRINFNGNASWMLMDEFITDAANTEIDLLHGTLNTNDQHVLAWRFYITSSNVQRSLYLGNSLIEITGYDGWYHGSASVMLDAGTSTFLFTASNPDDFHGGPLVYHAVEFSSATGNVKFHGDGEYQSVIFHGNATIEDNASFHDLTLTPGKDYVFGGAGTANTISGTMQATGTCHDALKVSNGNLDIQGTIMLDHVAVQDLTLTNTTIEVDHGEDLGGNSGILFNSADVMYWVGNSGDWNDGSHWSTSSGGVPSGCVPQQWNHVIFDQNSFDTDGYSVIVDETSFCKDLTWIDVPAVTLGGAANLEVHGAITLDAALEWTSSGKLIMRTHGTDIPITTAGVEINSPIEFNGDGSWILQDDLLLSSVNAGITLISGSVNTNDQYVRTAYFLSEGVIPRSLSMGGSTFEVTGSDGMFYYGTFIMFGSNMTFEADSSTIEMSGLDATFHSGDHIYHKLHFSAVDGTGKMNWTGGSYHELFFHGNAEFSGTTTDRLVLSPGGYYTSGSAMSTIHIVDEAVIEGTCEAPISISNIRFNKSAGLVEADHVVLERVIAEGGASFQAENATDIGLNTGWIISTVEPRTLYWIGNSGDWSNASHWSGSSGGEAVGCIPRAQDAVIFDGNSFTLPDAVVNIDQQAYCKDMLWSAGLPEPVLSGSEKLYITGSLTLSPDMMNAFTGDLVFTTLVPGNMITTAGNALHSDIRFEGSGGWLLMDTFVVDVEGDLWLRGGWLNTNDQHVDIWQFTSGGLPSFGIQQRTLTLGSSHVRLRRSGLTAWNNALGMNMTVDAGTSLIELSGSDVNFLGGGGFIYHDLLFSNVGNLHSSIGNYDAFSTVTVVPGVGHISLQGEMNDLVIPRGKHIFLSIALNNDLIVTEGTGEYAFLESGTITKTSGSICLHKALIRNVQATGGAVFQAGSSVVFGNTSGWIMESCAEQVAMDHSATEVCEGGSVAFGNISGGNVLDQQWIFPGGEPDSSTDPMPVVTYTAAGSYPVSLIVTYADGTDTLIMNDLVIVSEVPPVTITSSANELLASVDAGSYQWLDCNDGYAPIDGAMDQIFAPSASGLYAVQVEVDGCIALSECIAFIITDLEERNPISHLRIMPNPNNGAFTLELPEDQGTVSISITDITGRLVLDRKSQDSRIEFQLDRSPGVYLLTVDSPGGTAINRIVVQ